MTVLKPQTNERSHTSVNHPTSMFQLFGVFSSPSKALSEVHDVDVLGHLQRAPWGFDRCGVSYLHLLLLPSQPTHAHKFTHMHMPGMHVPRYMYMYTRTHRACTHTYRYTYTHACMHACMHAYITLHYITLHYITLHYITLHYITFHYITIHCTILHCIKLHQITLHYIAYIHSIHCIH